MAIVKKTETDHDFEFIDKKENKRHYHKNPEVYLPKKVTRSKSDDETIIDVEEEIKQPKKTSFFSKYDNTNLNKLKPYT